MSVRSGRSGSVSSRSTRGGVEPGAYRYGSASARKYNKLPATQGKSPPRSPQTTAKTRHTTLRCGKDTRVSTDIHSVQHPGSEHRAGGVRHSINMSEIEARREEESELTALEQERESLKYLVAAYLEEREVLQRMMKNKHMENEHTLERMPGLEVAMEVAEAKADEAVALMDDMEDEHNHYKQERVLLQGELAEARKELYQLERDAARTFKAREELEGIKNSQAHKEKGDLIGRVADKEAKNNKTRKDINLIQEETKKIMADVDSLSGRIHSPRNASRVSPDVSLDLSKAGKGPGGKGPAGKGPPGKSPLRGQGFST